MFDISDIKRNKACGYYCSCVCSSPEEAHSLSGMLSMKFPQGINISDNEDILTITAPNRELLTNLCFQANKIIEIYLLEK